MDSTVSQFNYGMITPVIAFLMACAGSALGLRCTTRSVRMGVHGRRAAWLALGAVCIGSGIWTMHFVAMIGFTIRGAAIEYDPALTFLSLGVAVAVVFLGVFIVGYRGASPLTLGVAGVVTGGGVAAMHYIGMYGMTFAGHMSFDPVTVGLSVLIAVTAATAALWAAVSLHTLASAAAASVIMGVAVTGMHYTGMAAMSVHVDADSAVQGQSSLDLLVSLLPMVGGPILVMVVASVIVMFDPDMLIGNEPVRTQPHQTLPAHRTHRAQETHPGHGAHERPTASWPSS
ncbi:MHYT domain-containing protein [Streptomyces sp. CWNU-52B]|uniref:MHYT domain-containing protein n=1 Tax=unclassified Streptomyces TaxID=2593676 RepID=UPI0039BF67B4